VVGVEGVGVCGIRVETHTSLLVGSWGAPNTLAPCTLPSLQGYLAHKKLSLPMTLQ